MVNVTMAPGRASLIAISFAVVTETSRDCKASFRSLCLATKTVVFLLRSTAVDYLLPLVFFAVPNFISLSAFIARTTFRLGSRFEIFAALKSAFFFLDASSGTKPFELDITQDL